MQHLSEDSLVALALGEAGPGDSHIHHCDACSAEVAALRATADWLRAAQVERVEPPAVVWERIAAEPDTDARATGP